MANAWPMRTVGLKVGLKVLDLDKELDFYQRFGLRVLDQSADRSVLGFGENAVLELRRLRAGRPRPPRGAGLYHFALLLPDERALGGFIRRAAEQGVRIDGASDHLVSAALYLDDAEGNGIEVYADRPSQTWQREGVRVRMATKPLDVEAIVRRSDAPGSELPPDGRLGHVHFTTQDLAASGEFYLGLGMDETAQLAVARFFSWDAYHHHVGVNVFDGPATSAPREDEAGVDFVEVVHSGVEPGTVTNPDGVRLEFIGS